MSSFSGGQRNIRQLIGIIGIIFAVILFLSTAIYAYSMQQTSPTHISHRPQTAAAPVLKTPVVTCKTPAHLAGDSTLTIQSAGLKRTFLLHLPPSYGKQPQPLVVVYHGYSWTSQIMEHTTNMDSEADKAGLVTAYPQGVDDPPSWNAGIGAEGPTGDADDIQFTRDMLHSLEQNYCLDIHRIFLIGFSLGGGMVYRLACQLTGQLAAIATVSGAYYPLPEGCHPSHPLPIMEIHGAADQLAPYGGNVNTRMEGVQDYLNGWLQRDQCGSNSDTFFQQGDVTGIQWTHCAQGVIVRHYRVSDGGHTWPGSPNTTHAIDANVVIWQFFRLFQR